MKRCPTCQRTYPDDAPAFCVNDGTKLVGVEPPADYDPQKTILASAPPIPPQYQNPAPPPIKPPTQPPPLQQQPPPPLQQPVWPPPPQGQPPQAQNWGGYQQAGQYPAYPQQYQTPAVGSKGLSLLTLIIGLLSVLALALVFAMAYNLITLDYDVLQIAYYGSAATGVVALILGILALISRRQRSKWMAIIGLILGVPGILFFIYAQFLR